MDIEKQINEIQHRISDVETDYKVAVKTIKIGVTIFVVLLVGFFGITYKQIGQVVNKAVKDVASVEAIKTTKRKVEDESQKSMSKMASFIESVSSKSKEINDKITESSKQVDEILNDLKVKTNDVTTKGDNLSKFLNNYTEDAKNYIKEIEKIIPKLAPFSVSGIAEDGEIIKPPWGTTKDWNPMISPNTIKFQRAGIKEDPSYSIFGANFIVETKDDKEWIVRAKSIHKFGKSIYKSPAAVNYILIPVGKKGHKK